MSEGEYSDFGYCGQLVTLKVCNLRDLIDAYKAAFALEHGDEEWRNPDIQGFVAWLIVTEHCMPLTCSEVHIGSYGGQLELDA